MDDIVISDELAERIGQALSLALGMARALAPDSQPSLLKTATDFDEAIMAATDADEP